MEEQTKDVCGKDSAFEVGEGKIGGDIVWGVMDGFLITEVFELADGRIEVNWAPVDRLIPEEIEYLSDRTDMMVHKTQMQSIIREANIHYLFTDDGLWRGIRCRKECWSLYMRAKGWTDSEAAVFEEDLKRAPKKKIIPAELGK